MLVGIYVLIVIAVRWSSAYLLGENRFRIYNGTLTAFLRPYVKHSMPVIVMRVTSARLRNLLGLLSLLKRCPATTRAGELFFLVRGLPPPGRTLPYCI